MIATDTGRDLPPVDVDAALRAIAHRGPDHRGTHHERGVVLGHVRLAVLDLTPAGNQPMRSADGETVVVFNGEIYNHHALREELVARGHAFRSRTDTEVIVEGYRAWGEGVIERLDGMFAVAIWDARKRSLLLSTDRPGKKPLFWAEHRGAIWFASEIKALLAAGVPSVPHVEALPSLLSLGYVPAPDTMHRGVSAIAPASRFTLRQGGGAPAIRRYYSPPFVEDRVTLSLAEAERRLRELVEAAVARRLEADVPLGAFLSGGIDSTIVAGVASRMMTGRLRTFSIGFSGDPAFDETRYARLASKSFGTDHTEFVLEPSSFDAVERLVYLHDGPFGDSSAIPTSIVSMLTRRHVTVALTGDGGDELFCGYPRFLAAEFFEHLPRTMVSSAAELTARASSLVDSRGIARAGRFLSVARRPLEARLAGWLSYFPAVGELLRPELRATLNANAAAEFQRRVASATLGAAPLQRILAQNYDTYLPYDLLVKADRASMAHSLEVRSPLLDRGVTDFAARLPARWLRRGLTTKWLLRRAFRDVIPQAILARRRKMGFGMPLDTWMRGELRPYVQDHLSEGAAIYEWLDPSRVRRLLDAHLSGRASHGAQLWLLLTLQVWMARRSSWLASPPT